MVITDPQDIRPKDIAERVAKLRKYKPFKFPSQQQLKSANTKQRSQLDTGLETYSGDWSDRNVAHLIKRTLFGVKKETLEKFKTMSMDEAVDALLSESPIPAPPINNYNGTEDGDDPDVASGESWVQAGYSEDFEGLRIVSLKGWSLKNMLDQEDTLHEKMIFFWHNLLVTQFFGVFISKASYQYHEMLRRNAFGNFKTLIKELTLDPAMLVYLNGTFNHKDAPDENYARELQELFTIGKGPGSGYTEGDVQAAARVLTGFVIDFETFENEGEGQSYFLPAWHDTSDKTFSEFYGNRVIEGKSGLSGADELDEMLEMIFDTNEAALYITRRLYNFFIYSEIDEQAEQNVIEPLAQIMRDNDYEIMPVLDALFRSAHFHDAENHGALIKNPLDFMIGSWKTLKMEGPDDSDLLRNLYYYVSQLWAMGELGLEMGDPPSVAGWPAYYQSPQFDKSWVTTDSITNRAEIMDLMVIYDWYLTETDTVSSDLFGLIAEFSDPYDPNALLQEAIDLFCGIELSDEGFATLKSVLLANTGTDYYWTNAYTEFINNPDDPEARNTAENRLKAAFQWLFQTGEFQLM